MQFIGTKSMVTETATWSKFTNGSKSIVEQILVSEVQKSEQDCESHSQGSE